MRFASWPGRTMLVLLGVMATTSFAQPQRGGRALVGRGIFQPEVSPIELATKTAVQKELAVTNEQSESIKRLSDDLLAELRKLSAEVQAASSRRADIHEKYKGMLPGVLTADQMNRLEQIAYQTFGYQVFTDSEVISQLKLSQDQQSRLASMNREYTAKQRQLSSAQNRFPRTPAEVQEHQAQQNELNRSREADGIAILTEDQQQQLVKMKGKKFDAPATLQFPYAATATAAVRLLALVTKRPVEQDLMLSDEQVGKLKRMADDYAADTELANSVSAEQANSENQIRYRYRSKLNQVLNEQQRSRLEQILFQASGSQVYSRPDVITRLKLSPEQQNQLSSINLSHSAKLRELRPTFFNGFNGADLQAYQEKTRSLEQQRDGELLAVLTAEQQRQLAEMKGKEFDLSQLQSQSSNPTLQADATRRGNAGILESTNSAAYRLVRELRNEAFAKSMKFTDEQSQQLSEIERQRREHVRTYPQTAAAGSDEIQQWRARLAEMDTRYLSVLNDEQKKLWAERELQIRVSQLVNEGTSHQKAGRFEKALECYSEAIKPDDQSHSALNERAWLLATGNDTRVRNGKQAIEDATKACESSAWKLATYVDTLAAAYAESGDFENAVKWQTRAIEEAEASMKDAFTQRLQMYKAGKPHREPLSPPGSPVGINNPIRPRELQNPGFEFGTEDWDVIGAESQVDTDAKTFHTEKESLRISALQPSDTIAGQEIMLQPARWYRFSGWVRTHNLDPMDAQAYGTFQIQLPGGRGTIASGANHKCDSDWTEVTIDFEAPANGLTRICPIFVGSGKGTGTVWFDDLKIEELSPTQVVDAIFANHKPFDFDFHLKDIDGKAIAKSDFDGKVMVVDVWGTWCPPCRREIPHFVAMQKKYSDAGLVVVGLNRENVSEDRAIELIRKFQESNEMNYRCALIENSIIESIPGFRAFPTTLFIDRSGKVRAKVVGYQDYDKLELMIRKLLDERN